jgi:hypothetical protein
MKDKDKYQGQRDYTHGWNLDTLRIERHTDLINKAYNFAKKIEVHQMVYKIFIFYQAKMIIRMTY